MRRVAFAVPGDLATPTGGYAYDRRMIAELQRLGWRIDVVDLGDGFPRPSAAQKRARARRLARGAEGPSGGDRRAGASACCRKRRERCVHDIRWSRWCIIRWRWRPDCRRRMPQRCARASARRSAARRRVIVTSAPTARLLIARLRRAAGPHHGGAARHRPRSPAPRRRTTAWCGCLSVGALVPRKGFDVLIAALATLTDLPWRLTIAGDRTRNPAVAARLDADIARYRLGDRDRRARRGVGRAHRRAVCRRRPVRAGLAFRGLRHGLCGGDRAWPAGDRHDRRRDPGDRAARRRHSGAAGRRRGACAMRCAG